MICIYIYLYKAPYLKNQVPTQLKCLKKCIIIGREYKIMEKSINIRSIFKEKCLQKKKRKNI